MNKTYSLDGVQAMLAYPFKTPGWQSKFLIGAALFFANYIIPIIPSIFLLGYSARIMRAIIVENAEPSLPEWDEWGKLFSRGFKLFCAMMIYLFPVIALMVGGYLIMVIPIFLGAFSASAYRDNYGSTMGVEMLGVFGGMILFFLGFVLSIPLSLLLPPAVTHAVAKDSFGAAFRVREWGAILRANLWGFFAAIVIVSGVYLVLLMAVYAVYFTIILCILMPVLLSVVTMYISAISAAALGEAYRKGVENLAPAPAA